MKQVIADNGVVEENDSNSFFPLVDSLRFEVKSVLLILSVIIVALAGQEINWFLLSCLSLLDPRYNLFLISVVKFINIVQLYLFGAERLWLCFYILSGEPEHWKNSSIFLHSWERSTTKASFPELPTRGD